MARARIWHGSTVNTQSSRVVCHICKLVPLALDHPPVDGVPHEHLAVLRGADHDVAVLSGRRLGHALHRRRVRHQHVSGRRDPLPARAVVDVPDDDLLGKKRLIQRKVSLKASVTLYTSVWIDKRPFENFQYRHCNWGVTETGESVV